MQAEPCSLAFSTQLRPRPTPGTLVFLTCARGPGSMAGPWPNPATARAVLAPPWLWVPASLASPAALAALALAALGSLPALERTVATATLEQLWPLAAAGVEVPALALAAPAPEAPVLPVASLHHWSLSVVRSPAEWLPPRAPWARPLPRPGALHLGPPLPCRRGHTSTRSTRSLC